ncbi:hypothetical protein [Sphingomonas sp. TDK1]|uniref:hypothetical protein n=1 Tax=Sphingomonas sp. TDK1 TaxID=453247 RepID=UPI0007D9C73D|nr:hypothetical protein [Sphingomonas sp. TDK1]OAN67157.1 hypothetical protein A7X12_00580 [Sphingomonas sp. TDK1]
MTVARWKLTDLVFAFLALLLFLVPAALNHSPILYPDSLGYFQAGRAATHAAHIQLPAAPAAPSQSESMTKLGIETADGVSDARSVYYGAAFVIAWSLFGIWALPLAQAMLCVVAIYAALRRLAPDSTRLQRWAVVGAIGLFGGAGAFATTIMPDVFAGLLILSVVILAIYGRALSRTEIALWLALGVAAVLFHKTHLLLAIGLLIALFLLGLLTRRMRWRGIALVVVLIGMGGLGQVAFNMAVRHAGLSTYSPPFLMARLIGDGTAEKYLREACPQRHYTSCRFLPAMPMTENEFLWAGNRQPAAGFAALSAADKARVCDEQMAIVLGTLRTHGLEQLGKSVAAIFRQLGTVGITEYSVVPRDDRQQLLHPDIAAYQGSAIATHTMPLQLISGLMLASYVLGGLVLIGTFIRLRRGAGLSAKQSGWQTSLFDGTLLMGFAVLMNGAMCGAISGVFDRYQGRVAWLVPLFALAVLLQLRASKRPILEPRQ